MKLVGPMRRLTYRLAALCIGGGEAAAVIVEKVN